ncbi:MAG: phosphoribosyltransferase [Gammaproteobacteria bacterium]
MRFRDRREAGRKLAEKLLPYAGRPDVVVLALPRGGVPVGFEVAERLGVPLDVFVVRKLGVPGHEDLAMGAVASGGTRVLNREVIDPLHIPEAIVDAASDLESHELARRERLYRHDRPVVNVRGRTVLLVDDGLATGATMRSAIRALRELGPRTITIAVPVAAADTCESLSEEADVTVCAITPEPFYAVGFWYEDFSQTTDEEVRELLERAQRPGDEPGKQAAQQPHPPHTMRKVSHAIDGDMP